MPPTQSSSPASARIARLGTLILSKAQQIAGLVFGIRELTMSDPDETVLIFCAFLIMGIEAAQEIIMRIIDRLLGDEGDR